MALALAPYSFASDRRAFSVYAYRSPQGLKVIDLDSPAYDYPSQNWYLVPTLLGHGVWSEPYFDEGGGDILMSTFSAPMVKKGQVLGVVTADVDLGYLGREVRSLAVSEGATPF